MNEEFLKQEKEKETEGKDGVAKPRPRKRRKRDNDGDAGDTTDAKVGADDEANNARNSPKLSKKINYSVLQEMMADDDGE